MSVRHVAAEGQHTLVRIEHTHEAGDAVQRVEYEFSDDLEAIDSSAGIGPCFLWALDAITGSSRSRMTDEFASALDILDNLDDDPLSLDAEEAELKQNMIDAACMVMQWKRDKAKRRKATTKQAAEDAAGGKK
jgi:hypothetical protein